MESLIDRALELDESYGNGAIHNFMISYEMSRPGVAGDPVARARKHFERALALSNGTDASPLVALAEAVTIQKQDVKEFESLLNRALAINPDAHPDSRLVNTVMQRRAPVAVTQSRAIFDRMKMENSVNTCPLLLPWVPRSLYCAEAAAPIKVRLGTLAPRFLYTKHLQVMGEAWRQAPGGSPLTIYPDGTMGSEADMVHRMRLGQLAAMVTTGGSGGGVRTQDMPKVFAPSSGFIEENAANARETFGGKRLHRPLLVRYRLCPLFSSNRWLRPTTEEDQTFVAANRPAGWMLPIRRLQSRPVEVADILPNLQTGLIDCVCMPPAPSRCNSTSSLHMLDMNWCRSLAPPSSNAGIPSARNPGCPAKTEAGKQIVPTAAAKT
jgi:hypothetical protein